MRRPRDGIAIQSESLRGELRLPDVMAKRTAQGGLKAFAVDRK